MSVQYHRLDRRALFASGAAAALLAATGVSAHTRPKSGGRLRMALSGAGRGDSFDSRAETGTFMQIASVGAVFDTLTEVASDGTLRGELATAWTGSPDARSWDFELRKGVVFHNAAPLTARDVVASLDLHRADHLSTVDRITAISDHRLRVNLGVPNPHFPYLLSSHRFIIFPADDLAAAMRDGIGTGLYRVRRFLPGRQFLGQRVEHHYKDGQAGWFDEVEIVSIPSASVRIEALLGHFVDVSEVSDPASFSGHRDISLLPTPTAMTQAVRRNIAMPVSVGIQAPLDNLRAAERWWIA